MFATGFGQAIKMKKDNDVGNVPSIWYYYFLAKKAADVDDHDRFQWANEKLLKRLLKQAETQKIKKMIFHNLRRNRLLDMPQSKAVQEIVGFIMFVGNLFKYVKYSIQMLLVKDNQNV